VQQADLRFDLLAVKPATLSPSLPPAWTNFFVLTFLSQSLPSCLSCLPCLPCLPCLVIPFLFYFQIMTQLPSHPLARPGRSPIDLSPEIVLYIGNHLSDTTELASCACVSKEWHAILSPLLYMVLNLEDLSWNYSCPRGNSLSTPPIQGTRRKSVRAPSAEAFRKYGGLIKHLAVGGDRLHEEDILSTITSLQQLRMHGSWSNSINPSTFRILFLTNPRLRYLDLKDVYMRDGLSWITQACPNLEMLRINDARLEKLDIATGLTAC